jgi:hypothetical protein|tara:strand:+ start:387 stop:503 length:117 start_codon:yes stop_codon:yes gene_type:complete
MAIARAQMSKQIQNPASKLSQKRKKVAAKKRKKKELQK